MRDCNGPATKPPRRRYSALALVCLGLGASSPACSADALSGLGNLDGGSFSVAYGTNADGTVVVGYGDNAAGQWEAYRWTAADGMKRLGYLAGGGSISAAYATNGDGSVVVGYGINAGSGHEAFRWTAAGGMAGLGFLGGTSASYALGTSGDGSVVVGYSGIINSKFEAFRWTAAGGMVGLGALAQGATSYAFGISSDGAVVVGSSRNADGNFEAFRWTAGGGMAGLGTLGGSSSLARAASSDGSVVVGNSANATGRNEAFRWTAPGGMVGLGMLTGGTESYALATNGDGSVVVGYGENAGGMWEAFRWTSLSGTLSLADWLAKAGVATAGWKILSYAHGVDESGNIVVGYGNNVGGSREAFIARVDAGKAGIVSLTDLQASLARAVAPQAQLAALNGMALNGAHHLPLTDIALSDGRSCAWASGDLGRMENNGQGWLGLSELGACHDFAGTGIRAGIGVGASHSAMDQANGGHTRLNGQYAVGEVDWVIPNTPLVASLLGLQGRWRGDMKRGYAAGTASSHGAADMAGSALRARLDWHNAFNLGPVVFTPSVQYSETRSRIDAYQESGGTAPAAFDAQRNTARESRLALGGTYVLNGAATLRSNLEWAHRFDSQGPALTGKANVLDAVALPFSFSGGRVRKDWGRVGAGVDYKLGKGNLLSISANAASSGQDADYSLGAGWKVLF